MVGGWAHRGYTSAQQLANVTPIPANVLILLNGTNDLGHGINVDQQIANDRAIAAKVGAPIVVQLAIPPFNHPNPADGSIPARNAVLQAAAQQAGWLFFDPWVRWRAPDGGWVDGASQDGVHPTVATWHGAGEVVADYLRWTLH